MIYVVAQQHPTLPEVSMFTTTCKPDAEQYRGIGWTVLEIEAPQPAREPLSTQIRRAIKAEDERDALKQDLAELRAQLAQQTALVEKCMVAMNENADRGEKADAEVGRLVRKLALDREEFKAELDKLKTQKLLTDEQIDSMWQNTDTGDTSMDGRVFARAIEAAVRTGGAG